MTLRHLSQQFASEGRIDTIILRPVRGELAVIAQQVLAETSLGLIGDHRTKQKSTSRQASKREVTLFQSEHLPLLANWCGMRELDPRRLRRNLLISGLNLISMRSLFPDSVLVWAIGDEVRIQVTGPCDPCSKLAADLGMGSYNALRGHGGMTARILVGGMIRVGDRVTLDSIMPRVDRV